MEAAKVLGFDPASIRNLGWSLIDVEESGGSDSEEFTCEAGTLVIPKVSEPWRALWPLFIAIDTIITEKEPDLVVVEKTSSFAGGFVTGQVAGCIGVILACCGKSETAVAFVPAIFACCDKGCFILCTEPPILN